MNRHDIFSLLSNNRPHFARLEESQSPSDELEQNALREFGDRDEPTVKAIFYARRHAREITFFVGPLIQAAHGLGQQAMKRAMDRLEGRLIETTRRQRGAPRWIRLLPDWENPEAVAGDLRWYYQRIFTETVIANGGGRLGIEEMRSRYPDLMLPPQVLEVLQRLLGPSPKPREVLELPGLDEEPFDDGISRPFRSVNEFGDDPGMWR